MPRRLPNGYPPFTSVKEQLPRPERTAVDTGVELEALHLPGPGPAVVFVHGGFANLWNHYLQLHEFRGEREVLAYSLAGNGGSTDRPEQTVSGHVADLVGLLDELGVEDPVVHGWSYGTAVALEYAKRYPTAGLVLHAGGSHDLTPGWEKPVLRAVLALRLYRLPTSRRLLREYAYRVLVHEETPEAVVDDFLDSNPPPRRRSAWETVTKAFVGYDGRADLHTIDVPTLVVHGPADGLVPVRVGRETAAALPDAVFCLLERTGHIAPVERPDAYNRLLRALLTAARSGEDLLASVRRAGGEHVRIAAGDDVDGRETTPLDDDG